MNRIGQAVVDNTSTAVKDVAKMTLSYLISETPILTGQAKANWQISIGSMPSEAKIGFTNYQMALVMGYKTIDSRKSNEILNISNLLPYLALLNAGSSQQAPANFIQIASEKARQHLQKLKVT